MLKLAGIFCIFFCIIGIILLWKDRIELRLQKEEGIVDFFRYARYAMGCEKLRIYEILSYSVRIKGIGEFMQDMLQVLEQKKHTTGEAAWRELIEKNKKELDLSKEGYALFINSADALFGFNIEENMEHLEFYQEKMEQQIELDKKDYMEKRKLVFPLGILGGLAIIVLFL